MRPRAKATVEDLYQVSENGEAELVGGEVVLMFPTGGVPGRSGGEIYISLHDYERLTGHGYAFPGNVGFLVDLPNRGSFSPEAAFHPGPLQGGRFMDDAPIFAVEVRSESDYGERAERELAVKCADYFAAGTLVVWNVGILRERVVRVYCADNPGRPTIYRSGDVAEAERVLPGWTMPVDDILSSSGADPPWGLPEVSERCIRRRSRAPNR